MDARFSKKLYDELKEIISIDCRQAKKQRSTETAT